MIRGTTRLCDICTEPIPKGKVYRVGYTTPDAAAAIIDTDNPAVVPTWTQDEDGIVRFDVCLDCSRPMLWDVTEETVDD